MYPEIRQQDAKNLFELLKKAAQTFGDKNFLRYEENYIETEKSYRETYADSPKIAHWAADAGKSAGHRLRAALLGRTGYEYLVTLFGVLGGNGLAIPLDIQLSNENMVKNLDKADTDVLFYDWEFRSQVTYINDYFLASVKMQITSLIHLHEHLLSFIDSAYRDILFFELYKKLNNKIDGIDTLIEAWGNRVNQMKITRLGGIHSPLFLLKSLDIDVEKGYKLGTTLAYGQEDSISKLINLKR